GVVPVLLAPLRVAPGRLDVTVRVRGDPDVGPRGRDREALDPREGVRVVDLRAVAAVVGERPSGAPASDAGYVVRAVRQGDPGGHDLVLGAAHGTGFPAGEPRANKRVRLVVRISPLTDDFRVTEET